MDEGLTDRNVYNNLTKDVCHRQTQGNGKHSVIRPEFQKRYCLLIWH